MRGVQTVTEGWPERLPLKPTKDAAVAIRRGQVWRQGARRLLVQSDESGAPLGISYTWIDATGREKGRAIVGRRHLQHVREQRFREKFRFVCEPEDASQHGLEINDPEAP